MQINLKTSFGIDDTLHVPRVFVISIMCAFYGGGQQNINSTNNNKNNNEKNSCRFVVIIIVVTHWMVWQFCIFDGELECLCVLGSLKCLRCARFNKSWKKGTCDACASIKISQAINAVLSDNGH